MRAVKTPQHDDSQEFSNFLIIFSGGLCTGPAKPLPEELSTIADSATNGLVVVSFGSILVDLPEAVVKHLQTALSTLYEFTIVWKYNGPQLQNLPHHIKVLQWLPQNDLLGHPNTKLFVTHCGNNGQFEGLYHGVPMVGIPVFGDQPYNAARMKNKGFGETVPISELTAEKLVTAIRVVINNDTYFRAIHKASAVYRGQPMTAQQRATFWVQHVLDYGSEHLMSPGVNLPWHQYWLIDVGLFLIITTAVCVMIMISVIWCCIRLCYRAGNKLKIN